MELFADREPVPAAFGLLARGTSPALVKLFEMLRSVLVAHFDQHDKRFPSAGPFQKKLLKLRDSSTVCSRKILRSAIWKDAPNRRSTSRREPIQEVSSELSRVR